jgi:hypothetical protein
MTDERMIFIAKQSLAMGKTELRVRGDLHGIFASYFEGQGLHRMRSLEKLIVAMAGEDWLNSPWKKQCAFGIMCYCNSIGRPEAMAFVSVINRWEGTAAFKALPEEEQGRVYNKYGECPREHPKWFVAHDAMMSSVQTPERLCLLTQRLQMPGALLIGELDIQLHDQENFRGNLKLFGDPPADIVEAIRKAPPGLVEMVMKARRSSSSSSSG